MTSVSEESLTIFCIHLLHVKSPTTHDLTSPPCHLHPTVLYHQPPVFSALLALNLVLYHLNLGILYQRNCLSWDLFKALVQVFMWWELNYPSL